VVNDNLKRGFSFIIADELLSEIISRTLGLEAGTLEVKDVTSDSGNRNFEIWVDTTDERFPVLKLGERYPRITPKLKTPEIKVQFQRFSEDEVKE
jgi:hypothetical protein